MRAGLLLAAAATTWAAFAIARTPRWTVDDAYIVARYAEHFVHHGILAYNLTPPRVEGFTSPLFMAVAVLGAALGRTPVSFMTAVGIAAFVASVPLVFALARALRVPPLAAGVAAWLYALVPEHLTHAMSGLETEAFMFAELLCAWACVRVWSGARPWRRAAPVIAATCLFVALARPEGLAVAGVVLIVALPRLLRSRAPGDRRRIARWLVGGVAAPLALLLVARVAYYHALLPNTFYAKVRGYDPEILRDIASLANDTVADAVVVSIAAVLCARLLGVRLARVPPRLRAAIVASVALLGVFAMTYAHKDTMNYTRRFAMHVLPWLATPALAIVSYAAGRLRRLGAGRGRRDTLLAWAFRVGAVAFVVSLAVAARPGRERIERAEMEAHIAVRKDLWDPAVEVVRGLAATVAARGHPPRLAVYADAGYLPYRTDLTTIDFGRLNDAYLAREARTPEDIVRYFFEVSPDVLVMWRYPHGKLFNQAAGEILEDARFSAYEPVVAWVDTDGAGIVVYARKG